MRIWKSQKLALATLKDIWHERLVHLGDQNLKRLPGCQREWTSPHSLIQRIPAGLDCHYEIGTQIHPIKPATRQNELIWTDLLEPIDPKNEYIVTYSDDKTRLSDADILPDKEAKTILASLHIRWSSKLSE